jgi:hypothetical protein
VRGLAVGLFREEDRGESEEELEERGEIEIEPAAVLSAEGRGRRREEGARLFSRDIEP